MNRFTVFDTPIDDLKLIERSAISDHRGYFERLFCLQDLVDLIDTKSIVQINRSLTINSGSVRGLHFQHPPDSECKFVTCTRGKVFDVAVDLRINSPTFLRFHSEILTENNHKTFYIPEGFAHGFQTLSDNCELLYLHTSCYSSRSQGALNAIDPKLGINWPLDITNRSKRDLNQPLICSNFKGISL